MFLCDSDAKEWPCMRMCSGGWRTGCFNLKERSNEHWEYVGTGWSESWNGKDSRRHKDARSQGTQLRQAAVESAAPVSNAFARSAEDLPIGRAGPCLTPHWGLLKTLGVTKKNYSQNSRHRSPHHFKGLFGIPEVVQTPKSLLQMFLPY